MENQLEIIVKESGLEQVKAQYILDKFKDSFDLAAKWEKQSKTIVVTNENQVAEMKMAKIGRLELKERRVDIENTRKKLKEKSLREGKAIDGIANVLKALIVPIEEYLERQEKYVEIQEENKREAMRLEIEKRMADELIAKEKAEAEERERIRVENEKLKAEAAKREKQMAEERKKQEIALAAERAKANAEKIKAEAERRVIEEKARKEREAAGKAAREAKEKADADRRAIEAKAAKEREKAEAERLAAEVKAQKEKEKAKAKIDAERKEKERLEEILKNQDECPHCHKKFQLDKVKR